MEKMEELPNRLHILENRVSNNPDLVGMALVGEGVGDHHGQTKYLPCCSRCGIEDERGVVVGIGLRNTNKSDGGKNE